MVKHSSVLLQAISMPVTAIGVQKDQCSSHENFLNFILFQRRTHRHDRDFLWPPQVWKLCSWTISYGLPKCGFPFLFRPMCRLGGWRWAVFPGVPSPPFPCSSPTPGHGIAGICRIAANWKHRAGRAIATHHGMWHRSTPCSPNGEFQSFLSSLAFSLPSVLQCIFLCFTCKCQAFPVQIPKAVLAELCPSLCSGQYFLLPVSRGRPVSSAGARLILLPIQGLTLL